MDKNKKYSVLSHKFLGYNESGSATYEITFNKSLQHTGRVQGIEDGLNEYCKKELKTNMIEDIKNLWFSIKNWIKN